MKTTRLSVIAMLLLNFLLLTFTIPAQAIDNVYNQSIIVANKKTGKSFELSSIAITNLLLIREILISQGLSEHIETLQAMMMVETRAGTGGSIGLPRAHPSIRSYGLMQVTVPTARVMFRDFPEMLEQFFGKRDLKSIKDKEIKNLLLTNNTANVILGIAVFSLYLKMVNGEWARAVAAYNMGIGNALKRKHAIKSDYVKKVREWIPFMKDFNEQIAQTETPVTTSNNSTLVTINTNVVDIVDNFDPVNDTSIIDVTHKENNNGEETNNQQ